MPRKLVTFVGNNGVANISVPGVLAGDKVVSIVVSAGSGPIGVSFLVGSFSDLIFTDGEIRQFNTGDISALTFTALIERHVLLP